jgi:hypothetical protein
MFYLTRQPLWEKYTLTFAKLLSKAVAESRTLHRRQALPDLSTS